MTELSELRRWMAGIHDVTAAVASDDPPSVVLDTIAGIAVALMDYDFCGVFLSDDVGSMLTIEGSHGLSAEYIARINADRPVRLDLDPSVEAPSSRAFRTGEPVAIDDIVAAPNFGPWGGVAREQGYRSMVSVPLLGSTGAAIGTLNCYRRGVHVFDDNEIQLLSMLATQASISVTITRLRAEEAQRTSDLRTLNAELQRRRTLLEKSEEIHRRLTTIASRGGGVDGIATALSLLVGRSVTIEDVHGGVLAQSSRGPTSTSAHREDVLLSGERVACLVVEGDPATLSTLDRRAVEHTAVVAALELLRARTAEDVQWRLQGEVVGDLLGDDAVAAASAVERADRLGHDLTTPHVVAVIDLPSTGDVDASLSRAVRSIAARAGTGPLVAAHQHRAVVLWPVSAGTPMDSVVAEIERVRAGTVAEGPVTAVVGSPCTEVADYRAAHRAVRGAVRLMILWDRTGATVSLDQLGVPGLLLQLNDPDQVARYADRTLGPVREHDESRGTDLIGTLRAYLGHRQHVGDTAAALHVHPNTVGQRLRRVQTLTGLDLARPDHAMDVAMALTLRDIAAP
ncbi:helix-turn-helix domain-containing protein [Rhodococcus sp. BP-241]|uniref:helix-turn-helix domain-containing protein n=1 Tax=Rhodococcus sp. BP-241 TaxID=2739441 RepID=UPI001C9AFE9B|nr:helix-turn-helix domain-containing protein [Rhodococcus sp. BP-241]MBY6707689.1 helix-turn-helix domain-containing protein [Rhodococcus sp. BP-241]